MSDYIVTFIREGHMALWMCTLDLNCRPYKDKYFGWLFLLVVVRVRVGTAFLSYLAGFIPSIFYLSKDVYQLGCCISAYVHVLARLTILYKSNRIP
jgi:hypothetical protein